MDQNLRKNYFSALEKEIIELIDPATSKLNLGKTGSVIF